MTTHSHIRHLPVRRTGIKGFFARLLHIDTAYRQRRALERLDDAALKDLGLSRDQVKTESRRPVWDVPAHWRA